MRIVRERRMDLARAHAEVMAWARRREEQLMAHVTAANEEATRARRAATAQHEAEVAAADQELALSIDVAERERDSQLAAAAAEYTVRYQSVIQQLDRVASSDRAAKPWDDDAWGTYLPSDAPPAFVRLGMLEFAGRFDKLSTPALLPFVGGRNLVIHAAGAAKAKAIQGVQSVLLQQLMLTPPAKLQFLLVDPVGLGENVASFMHLGDDAPELITGKAWVERADIEKQLAELSAYMETVIQGSLRGRYSSIEELNAEAKELSRGYRVLVVIDFPVNFTEESARRLLSIAQNGPRCGVYTIVTVDTDQPLPRGFTLADLERTAHVFTETDGLFTWKDPDFSGATVQFDAPPLPQRFEQFVRGVGAAAQKVGPVEIPFVRLVPPSPLWQENTIEGLEAPIGRTDVQKPHLFSLGRDTAQHALVAGRTGSGKTNLFNVLIAALVTRYAPTELELYLIDFKKGVGFKPYATHALPHARVVAIESEREFGISVLRRLNQEMTERGARFRGEGGGGLEAYRSAHPELDHDLPRVLLLVDEFQEFFTPPDDAIGTEAKLILDRLTRQGREFGIHVVMGSQTLAGTYSLARSTMDQMAVRVALQCSEADSQLILGKDNPAAHRLVRAGEAIYNDMSGLKEGNRNFQVAWLDRATLLGRLQLVRREADQVGLGSRRPIVFEGNAPANLSERPDHPLVRAAEGPSPAKPPAKVQAWLGEPIAISDPTAAIFFRRGGRNLVIVGRDEVQAVGMLGTAILSLASQYPHAGVRFLVCDLTLAALEQPPFAESIGEALPNEVRCIETRQLAETITELAATVGERQTDGRGGAATYLLIAGLHRARTLRAEGGGFRRPEAPASPADHLATVLRDGPEVGVHVLAWADTVTSLQATIDRRLLGEFGIRVLLAMNEKDSNELAGSPAAARLREHRALLVDEEQAGGPQTFRPYVVPDGGWVESVGALLRAREAAAGWEP